MPVQTLMLNEAVDALESDFLAGGWPYLEELKATKAQEDLHVDYKQKEKSAEGTSSRSDRVNLSTALSGFANADGGLLVWGVDARRGPDGIDHVQDLVPISEIDRFHSELKSLSTQLVSFGVHGIRHHLIRNPVDNRSGIVLTVVPRSDLAPHMATGPGLHSYYRRVGSDFIVMEHYEVADLFGRRPHPKLEVEIGLRITYAGLLNNTPFGLINLKFVLRNRGNGLMRFPCISIEPPVGLTPGMSGGVGSPTLLELAAPANWWKRFAGTADTVVYPSDEVDVLEMRIEVMENQRTLPDLSVTFNATAADCPAIQRTQTWRGAELSRAWQECLLRDGPKRTGVGSPPR